MNAQCRKLEKSEWRNGENSRTRRRKGPRKCGVDSKQQSRFRSLKEEELQGPPSRTRASLKRKLQNPSSTKQPDKKKVFQEDQSSSSDQTHIADPKGSPRNDVCASNNDQPLVGSSATQQLPEKQTLELIIDTLQRRDVYEIFAEPVDPEEVEDYYEIIKEPMDFGTMRAKLHEGMYTSLEQFEHDVFLISGNAMHFNSSSTIFFRQARALHELAKKVFHVLRTDPENFESEFLGTRRRICRRSQAEAKELNHKSLIEFDTDAQTGCTAFIDDSLKSRSSSVFTSTRRNPRANKSFRGGTRDSKRHSFVEEDRRSTYRPHFDLEYENDSKSLIPLNQHEFGYNESLTRFVKDLGPTAQMVAKRKLKFNLFRKPSSNIVEKSHGNQNQMNGNQDSIFNDEKQDSSSVTVICKTTGNQSNRIQLDLWNSIANDGKHDSSVTGIINTMNRDQDSLRSGGIIGAVLTNKASEKSNVTDLTLSRLGHSGGRRPLMFKTTSAHEVKFEWKSRPFVDDSSRFAFDLGFLKSKMVMERGLNKDMSFTQQLGDNDDEEAEKNQLALFR